MQTARRAIARGDIGEPLSAQTVIQYIGPDTFHPNPEFLFSPGPDRCSTSAPTT